MRCEPSWKWQISAEHAAVVKQLRPRSRLGPPRLRAAERDLVYQWCNDLGRLANIEERHWLAHAFFESAYNTKEDVAMLISSVNMRLNAGQCSVAATIYSELLQGRTGVSSLTDAHRELISRKLAEARARCEERTRAVQSASRAGVHLGLGQFQDEVGQLVSPLPRLSARGLSDRDTFVRLMRRCAHAAYEEGDLDAALQYFDSCFAVSRDPVDLLSGANLRVKLDPTSYAAEAIYELLLSEAGSTLSVQEAQTVALKLETMRDARALARRGPPQGARGAGASAMPSAPIVRPLARRASAEDYRYDADEGADSLAWLSRTALRPADSSPDSAIAPRTSALLGPPETAPCESEHREVARDGTIGEVAPGVTFGATSRLTPVSAAEVERAAVTPSPLRRLFEEEEGAVGRGGGGGRRPAAPPLPLPLTAAAAAAASTEGDPVGVPSTAGTASQPVHSRWQLGTCAAGLLMISVAYLGVSELRSVGNFWVQPPAPPVPPPALPPSPLAPAPLMPPPPARPPWHPPPPSP